MFEESHNLVFVMKTNKTFLYNWPTFRRLTEVFTEKSFLVRLEMGRRNLFR